MNNTFPLPPPLAPSSVPPPAQPPLTPPVCDAPTALSSLTSLLNLSSTTLHSLSSLLSHHSPPTLIQCPFNPNHRLPPSSLFSHSLHCPSFSPPNHIQTLTRNLNYPHTLHSSSPFTLPSQHSNSQLCFSLEAYLDSNNPTSFYSDCPGVVSFPLGVENAAPPMLTLPPLLSSECAHFGNDLTCFSFGPIRILPSEVYAIRKETESWSDYPFMYSYAMLRGILGIGMTSSMECLSTLIVANSARCYSIVLDLAMRDHMLLLFKLCLKAIVREAIDLASKFEAEESISSNQWFDCPVLVQVLMWLATQLWVLYGEMNGKMFAINLLKQCISDCAFSSCMFNEYTDKKRGGAKLQQPQDVLDETLFKSPIFVSQVAAAVAALHERSMFEENIKALRNFPSLPAYQRLMEHASISNKADEERQKRPNYRALLEHDGLLCRHSRNNQDSNRRKTKEELLAEERDYKRRRMSYRGKKLKRSTTQVMRDIIEEYMVEIKQDGTINCPTKGGEMAEFSLSTTYKTDSYYMDKAKSGKRQLDSPTLSKGSDGNVHSAERSNGVSRQGRKDYSTRPSQCDTSLYSRQTQDKRDYSKDSRDIFSRSSSRRYHKSLERSSSSLRERSDRKARDASDDFEDRYHPSEY